MGTEVRIYFRSGSIPGGAEVVLDAANCGPDVARIEEEDKEYGLLLSNVWVTLEETDPRLPVLLELLNRYRVVPGYAYNYAEEDLDGAHLLLLKTPEKAKVRDGVKYGTTYDVADTCPACGTSAKQTSALFIDAQDLKKLKGWRAVTTQFFHILVDPGLEADLVRTGATGISFRDVYAVGRDERTLKIPFRQLCADKTLPPLSPSKSGLPQHKACELCERNGYFTRNLEPMRIVYRASDLRDADDVNMSWENRGDAYLFPERPLSESRLSTPWMVVTPKVRRVFTDAGVTCFDWIPIRVEEG